jgi:multiple sugar transport system permease protein
MSFSDVTIRNILGDWPFVGLANFTETLESNDFLAVFFQTLLFVVFVLIATMCGGFIAALLLRSSGRYSVMVQTTLILVWTFPPVLIGVLWRFLLSSDGSVNAALLALGVLDAPIPFLSQPSTALASIAAVTVWVGIPFAGLVLKSAILDIPREVFESASIDGASSGQVIMRIIIPMIRPTILILAVLIVVAAFKAFDLIYVMSRGGPGTSSATLPYLGYITAFQDYEFGQAAAISVFAMMFVLALAASYIFALRKEQR